MRLLTVTSDELGAARTVELRALFDAAWDATGEPFEDLDWQHALGGVHVILEDGGRILAPAAVVERRLEAGSRAIRTGYVEAVATLPGHQGQGHGSRVMQTVNRHIDGTFELGALAAAVPAFYERLGWVRWTGPTGVRTPDGVVATPEEDGTIFVRLTGRTPPLDLSGRLVCDWRAGDVW
jgi:aminoglycoside 2'-N-acetyltransferase I